MLSLFVGKGVFSAFFLARPEKPKDEKKVLLGNLVQQVMDSFDLPLISWFVGCHLWKCGWINVLLFSQKLLLFCKISKIQGDFEHDLLQEWNVRRGSWSKDPKQKNIYVSRFLWIHVKFPGSYQMDKIDAKTWCLQNPIQNVDLNGFVLSPLRWDFKTSPFRQLVQ